MRTKTEAFTDMTLHVFTQLLCFHSAPLYLPQNIYQSTNRKKYRSLCKRTPIIQVRGQAAFIHPGGCFRGVNYLNCAVMSGVELQHKDNGK